MGKIIFSFLVAAGLAVLPGAAAGQDGMMDNYELMHEQDAGTTGYGMGGYPACRGGMSAEGCGMPGCGYGIGRSMMGGYGGRGMGGFGYIWALNLSPDQKSKLTKIQQDLRKKDWALKGKILDERAKLYDLYSAEKPDPKKIGAVYGAIFDIRKQMIESRIEARNRAYAMLNKKQQARLKQFRQGPHYGMGAGGNRYEEMHDMMSSGSETKQ